MPETIINIQVSAISDVGVVRNNNEDTFLLANLRTGGSLPDSCQINNPSADNLLLFVVSDGVGGSKRGELASEVTVLSVRDALSHMPQTLPITDRLIAAVEQANHLLWMKNVTIESPNDWLKATVTAVLVEKDIAYVATIGDSRAYIIRDQQIRQLTTDQTIAGFLQANGVTSPNKLRNNVILQAIGHSFTLQVAISAIQLGSQDYLLLCSDGLSNKVPDSELVTIIQQFPRIDDATQQMVALAKRRGGEDNITVILAQFTGPGLQSYSYQQLDNEVTHLTTFNPYSEDTKTHKRTLLLGNKIEREFNTQFPVEVRGIDTIVGEFVEQTQTLQLSRMDASVMLTYAVAVDDLLHFQLPMPKELRLFDLDKPLYGIYVQVRRVSPQHNGYYLVRVAFISQENPLLSVH
jgi:protein phosphatase